MQNKYSFSFTPLGYQDLDDALAYISEQLSNPQAATELLDEVEHTLASVCEFPYAFSDCSVYLISDQNIRHAIISDRRRISETIIRRSHAFARKREDPSISP